MKHHITLTSAMRLMTAAIAFSCIYPRLGAQSAPVAADPVSTNAEADEPVTLSPFLVTEENARGYQSGRTLVGSRIATDVMDIPAGLSIINRQLLDDLNATTLFDVLSFGTAGVTQNFTIDDSSTMRGFRTRWILRDGVPKQTFKRNPLYDVERVEVIKGPAAMMVGNNGFLGGAVNVVSMMPSHKPKGSIKTTFGTDSYVNVTANATGPLYEGKGMTTDYRVTVGGETGDPEKAIESIEQNFIGGALALYFGSNTTLLLNSYYFRDDGFVNFNDFPDYTSSRGTLSSPRTVVLNPYSTKDFSPGRSQDSFWKQKEINFNATLLTKLADNTNLRLFYATDKIEESRAHLRPNAILADDFTLTRQFVAILGKYYVNNAQVDVSNKWTTDLFQLDSTIGFDWLSESYRTDDIAAAPPIPPNLNTRTLDYSADEAFFKTYIPGVTFPYNRQNTLKPVTTSYYIQENLSFLKGKAILVGGMRWFTQTGFDTNHLTGVTTKRKQEKLPTHKYGLIVKPLPAVALYYTAAQNTIPQNATTDRFQAGDDLGRPMETAHGELDEFGVKFNFNLSKSTYLYGSLAHYDMILTNVRTTGVLPEATIPGAVGIIQSPGDTTQGWELEYNLGHKMESGVIDIIGTYTNGESSPAAAPGQQAENFAPRTISLLGKYTWTSGPLTGLSLGASYYDQTTKRIAVFFMDFPPTYNLFAKYEWKKRWSFQCNLNNITNERYVVATAGNTALVQAVQGMDANCTLKYSW